MAFGGQTHGEELPGGKGYADQRWTRDAVVYVTIGGVDYECRDHSYSATVLKLSDTFSVTIPAPGGKVRGADGKQVAVAEVAMMGAEVKLAVSDPNVQGGMRIDKLLGKVTGRRIQADATSGTVLQVTGADLGWTLSSCGQVFRNIRGLKWEKWIARNLGLVVGPSGATVRDDMGWGFRGVRAGNLLNRTLRLGRAAVQSDWQQDTAPSLVEPVFQIEVGQTLDGMIIQFAKLDHYLVNVSSDGWLQYFQPHYDQKPLYSFWHAPAGSDAARKNNVIRPVLDESADSLYTQVECWSTVIDTTANDQTDPNAGRYHGTYTNTGTLPFPRRYTFTDTEQMGQSRVDARAKWQWQRGLFDSWTYSFEVVGHSQDGVPLVEDTMCELHDSVYGVDGLFYVSAVEYTRKLARPGLDSSGAGTRAKVTLKRPNLLAA